MSDLSETLVRVQLDLKDGLPSLCDSSYCVGCGNTKLYRGKPASSIVCCSDCWKKLPMWLRKAFIEKQVRNSRFAGPTIWERRIAATLIFLKEATE